MGPTLNETRQEDEEAERACKGTWFYQQPFITKSQFLVCGGDPWVCARRPIKQMVAKALLHPGREGMSTFALNL